LIYPTRNCPRAVRRRKVGWVACRGASQDTIIKWFFDRNGQVKGVTSSRGSGPLIDMPINQAILHRPTTKIESRGPVPNSKKLHTKLLLFQAFAGAEAILFRAPRRRAGIHPGSDIAAASTGDPGRVAQVNMYKRIAVNLRTDGRMGLCCRLDTYEGVNGPGTVQQYRFELVAPEMRAASINLDSTSPATTSRC